MRSPLVISVALTCVLGVVAGNLWLELRAARQELADIRAQDLQPAPAVPQPQMPPPQAVLATVKPLEVSSPPAEAPPAPIAAEAAPSVVMAQLVLPVNRTPPVITEARRTNAMMQSEQTATARVLAWKDRLAIAGHTLTTEQLQALNEAAIAQMRREAEESLELESTNQPTDVESFLRQREETINRQNDTNMRILAAVSPQLTQEQVKALRAQFESGHAARTAAFRSEQETLRQGK
jgi:hypothetical protein